MKNYYGRSLQALAAIFTSFLVFAFADLARNGFISDSEIWAVTIAKNFREEWFQPWVLSRPFFYAPLAIGTAFFDTATSIFDAAKAVMVLNGMCIVIFTYRLARSLSSRAGIGLVTPWLAIILTLGNTGFLNQGYRIRSDLISSTFVLLALESTFREKNWLRPRKLFYWALPFLATPKAAIHVFPAISLLDRRRFLLVLFLGFFLTMLVFPDAIVFFLKTYTEPEASMGFFSPQRFVYFDRMVMNNPIPALIFALRCVTLAVRFGTRGFDTDREKEIHRGFAFFTLGSMFLLIVSPEKVPFFVASFLPVFAVFASLVVADIPAILQSAVPEQRRNGYLPLLSASIVALMLAITFRAGVNWNAFRENNSSKIQMTLVKTLENYLNQYPRASYYDVVGLVPQRATIRLFAGPNDQVANRNSLLTLEHIYKPDLIFMVRKIQYLQPGLGEMLKKDYFPIGAAAQARWLRLERPISLPLKGHQELSALLAQLKQRTGASVLSEVSVLVETKGKPERTLQLREEDFFNPKIVGGKSRMTAISPFTKIDPMTDMLPEIIRFDWDWTGNENIGDNIPEDSFLPNPF